MSNFQVTERAFKRIAKIMQSEEQGAALRISVEGGGCSGFQYKFDITKSFESDDTQIQGEGASVYVDSTSLPFIEGAALDYVEDLVGSAFKIVNPNATASCGCGTSFTV